MDPGERGDRKGILTIPSNLLLERLKTASKAPRKTNKKTNPKIKNGF
jgi:hypothetical protein